MGFEWEIIRNSWEIHGNSGNSQIAWDFALLCPYYDRIVKRTRPVLISIAGHLAGTRGQKATVTKPLVPSLPNIVWLYFSSRLCWGL